MKTKDSQIEEVPWNPRIRNMKKTTPGRIIIKLRKVSDKEQS